MPESQRESAWRDGQGRGVITVCHPIWQLACGGTERQLVQTVNGLDPAKFRHVVVIRGWDASCERLTAALAPHIQIVKDQHRGRDGSWPHRLTGILRDHGVDVLHARGLAGLVDAVIAAEHYGDSALAFSFHGFESSGPAFGGIRRKVFREAIIRCDSRWAVSDSAAGSITTMLNMPRDSFGIIANGVDTDYYTPADDRIAVRTELNLPHDRLILVSLGNLRPVKGHQQLLEAMTRLQAARRDVTLILVGADYLDGKLQAWAANRLGNFDIRFVGEQPDGRPWLQAADVFLLPSLGEGMSNALLEAMACGLPVIGTRAGGTPDVITHGECGYLVDANNPRDLSNALRRLIVDARLREELGAQAREAVIERFSVQKNLWSHEKHYCRLFTEMRSDEASIEPVGAVT